MISRGEVALIIAGTGLAGGLLDPHYYTSVIIMVIITTLVTPPMLKIMFADKYTHKLSNNLGDKDFYQL